MGLLVSPISWSHHWVWVVLIPPMLVGDRRRTLPAAVPLMLWGLVGLALLAPYWWFRTGIASDILMDSLALWGFATVVVWAVAEAVASRTTESAPSVGAVVTTP